MAISLSMSFERRKGEMKLDTRVPFDTKKRKVCFSFFFLIIVWLYEPEPESQCQWLILVIIVKSSDMLLQISPFTLTANADSEWEYVVLLVYFKCTLQYCELEPQAEAQTS